jgi:protocatechuate 3,4-dioxygenase alpha subunit
MKQTASQTVGPFFRIGLSHGQMQSVLVNKDTSGERITLRGLVLDGDGQPIPDALLEIWQPDSRGIFHHPVDPLHDQADPHFRGFGRVESRDAGRYEFKTIKPGRRDGLPPYINVHVFARGMLVHAMTRIYFSDETDNDRDPVLQAVEPERRQTLIATLEETDGLRVYHFDIHMQGEDETVFFNP